jgi:phage FluMu gp28-like protein
MSRFDTKVDLSNYLMPYQARWLEDDSRFKIWEKTRRGGMSFVQALEDVFDASREEKPIDVFFSSADASAATEYILYVQFWAELLGEAADFLGEVVIDSKNDIKALSVKFSTGKRIVALTSNPKAFRSKGGKLVLDEFAFHEQQDAMWKAAKPIVTWGFPVRVISTYNGKGNRYARMVADAKKGKELVNGKWRAASGTGQKANAWSLHTTTIEDAVAQGLADKILGRELTAAERLAWLDEERDACGDDATWMQEYMCEPVDGATAWLTYELIASCEHEDAGKPELYKGGPCYFGNDIGLRHDLWVLPIFEEVGDVLWCRELVRLKKKKFREHDAEMERVFRQYRIVRGCMDQTGMGEKPVEDAKRRYGETRIEGVIFNTGSHLLMANTGKQALEDRKLRIPIDPALRDSLHKLQSVPGPNNQPRFMATSDAAGHADEAWAIFLALLAAINESVVYAYEAAQERRGLGFQMQADFSDEDAGQRDGFEL